MFWIVAILLIICLFCYYDRKRLNYWHRKGVKQETQIPIFGANGWLLFKKMAFCDLVTEIYNSFGEVRFLGMYQFYEPHLVVRDPNIIKQICVKDFEHFIDHRHFTTEEADPLWNKNLFNLKGQKWKEMRSTLSPFFTGSKMRQMFVLMHECARNFASFLNNKPEPLIEIELKDAFTRYTNDVIATTAFGLQCDSLNERENEFYLQGKKATDFTGFVKNMKFILAFLLPSLSKLIGASFFDKDVTEFFRGVVRDSLKYRQEKKINRPDLINLLMQANKGSLINEEENIEETNFAAVQEHLDHKVLNKGHLNLSLDDITSQALIFFFAGFETVSSAMCFMAYELGVNQDIQKRLIEELDEFRSSNKEFTYEGLARLPYLDMVLSETLRKWPITVTTDRYCNKPFVIEPEVEGGESLQVDVGEIILIPIWGIHRDPKYWENPEKFDPERFSADNKHTIDPYTYLPFGLGPRNCIGSRYALTEVKVVFFELLSLFEIIPIEKSCIPFVSNHKSFILAPAGGFWFGLKKRST